MARNLLPILAWFLLFTLPLLVLMPQYSCYSGRARVSEALIGISVLKQEIALRAEKSKSLEAVGSGLKVDGGNRIAAGLVTRQGVLVVLMQDPIAAFVLTPELANPQTGELQWTCQGAPAVHMPRQCREPAP